MTQRLSNCSDSVITNTLLFTTHFHTQHYHLRQAGVKAKFLTTSVATACNRILETSAGVGGDLQFWKLRQDQEGHSRGFWGKVVRPEKGPLENTK